MAHRDEILDALNQWLNPQLFKDYCPNGLQVEGREQVQRILCGVTACQDLLDAAVETEADMVLVHHGYFWKGEPEPVVGMKKRRLETLLKHGISLVAYHLPLDAHPELGNNRCLARQLNLKDAAPLTSEPTELLWHGRLAQPATWSELAEQLQAVLGQAPLHVGQGAERIEDVVFCTGAAQGFIQRAIAAGAQAYISGEISEPTVHTARELGIHYFAAGHHATERYGVQALGERLADRFGIDCSFVDIPSPV
ncbi:Nif3-like dinuclear metal center hexameric protein [Marinobacteraceae bacterium S3BR75-40.1]